MTPRTGRPKVENPRYNRIFISLNEEDFRKAEEAREKDVNKERTLSTWASRKFAELIRKLSK